MKQTSMMEVTNHRTMYGAVRRLSRFKIQISNRLEEMAMAYNHRRAEREWRNGKMKKKGSFGGWG